MDWSCTARKLWWHSWHTGGFPPLIGRKNTSQSTPHPSHLPAKQSLPSSLVFPEGAHPAKVGAFWNPTSRPPKLLPLPRRAPAAAPAAAPAQPASQIVGPARPGVGTGGKWRIGAASAAPAAPLRATRVARLLGVRDRVV